MTEVTDTTDTTAPQPRRRNTARSTAHSAPHSTPNPTARVTPQAPDNRSPELRLAANAMEGLRKDLFHDAFAYRPLPRTQPHGRLARRFATVRAYAPWKRHIQVGALAGLALLISMTNVGPYTSGLAFPVSALVVTAPVLLTLVRPVAAFWASLAATTITARIDNAYGMDWPWSSASFVSHLLVLTIVALRTRPRTAGWMWVLTAVYGFVSVSVADRDRYDTDTDTVPMLLISALILLAVTVRHVRKEAREEVTAAHQEVTAQLTVTEHERSRRTLLEERTTIARELHDVVAHHMSVVAIQAEAAPYRVENPPPELEKAFVTIRENAVAALAELRRILGVVRAEDYEAPEAPQPTLADLDELIANVRETGLDVEKTVTGAVRELPQGIELSAYRIVQEALSNSLRHAPGAGARVEVGYVLGGLGVRVVNGPPPAPDLVKPSPGAGHGITGMRERVAMLSGEMTAVPTADGGFEVTVFLPVPTRETEGEA